MLVWAGCASSPRIWTPLQEGQSAKAVLSRVESPGPGRFQQTLVKLWIFRTDTESWDRLDRRDLEDVGSIDLALAAEIWCFEEFDGVSYEGRAVSWYRLPGGRLEAWDDFRFAERCALLNDYRPSPASAAVHELDLRRRARVPDSPFGLPTVELYDRALRLIEAGRTDEARTVMQGADETLGAAPDEKGPYSRQRVRRALERQR